MERNRSAVSATTTFHSYSGFNKRVLEGRCRRTEGTAAAVDGCVRDTPEARELGLPLFLRGATPHNAGHFEMYPWDYNVTIGCGGVLVRPGDIIVGDDDGVVVVPPRVAPQVIEYCRAREGREVFERIKLRETGDIEKYYPLNEEGKKEYEEWLRKQEEEKS